MLNAAVIGLGWWGQRLVESVKDSGLIRFSRGVTLEPEPARAFAGRYGLAIGTSFEDVLADPTIEAVALATPHTRHRAQVEAAARDGYAFSVEELEQGLNAVAAPVRDHTGGVIAALSVSGPVYRFTEERMREATPDVVAAAAAISHRMGHLD